nr:hypothetical protein [Tanacetum cinerariifolium]
RLPEGPGRVADLRRTDPCVAVCGGDRVLLLLLYGAGIQQQGNGGQLEEERRIRSGHSSGRADCALHRQDPDAPDPGR